MRFPFLKVQQDAFPRAKLLSGFLRVPRQQAMGMMLDLWAWALDLAPGDDLSCVFLDPDPAGMLSAALEWTDAPDKCLDAFVRAGLIERVNGGIRVRGPQDLYGATVEKRKTDRERAALGRASQSHDRDVAANRGDVAKNRSESQNVGGSDADADAVKEIHMPVGGGDVVEIQEAWNAITSPPLPRWEQTPKDRRRLALNALKRRPIEEWREVFRRANDSPYCRGETGDGWIADIDFVLRPAGRKPEPAAQALERTGVFRPGKRLAATGTEDACRLLP